MSGSNDRFSQQKGLGRLPCYSTGIQACDQGDIVSVHEARRALTPSTMTKGQNSQFRGVVGEGWPNHTASHRVWNPLLPGRIGVRGFRRDAGEAALGLRSRVCLEWGDQGRCYGGVARPFGGMAMGWEVPQGVEQRGWLRRLARRTIPTG
jgi:hypothetical protein